MAVAEYVTKEEMREALKPIMSALTTLTRQMDTLEAKIDAHHKAQMDAYEDMKTWGRSPNY